MASTLSYIYSLIENWEDQDNPIGYLIDIAKIEDRTWKTYRTLYDYNEIFWVSISNEDDKNIRDEIVWGDTPWHQL